MAATVDKLAKKYKNKRRVDTPRKPGKRPAIVPKIFGSLCRLYLAPSPNIKVPDPCPTVNLSRANQFQLRNLPKPTLIPTQGAPQDPHFYEGSNDVWWRRPSRCEFCGKFFGSDLALQIHIKTHTGERHGQSEVEEYSTWTQENYLDYYGYADEDKKKAVSEPGAVDDEAVID